MGPTSKGRVRERGRKGKRERRGRKGREGKGKTLWICSTRKKS